MKTHPVEQDESEDVVYSEMSLDEIKTEIDEGRMRNSLTLLSLTRVFQIWQL
jgi:hypothetical protein